MLTDSAGYVIDMDQAAERLLNITLRGARGRALLPYILEGRSEFVRAIRFVPSVGFPPRPVKLRPREKRPVAVSIELRQHADGIEWLIAVPSGRDS